MNKFTEEDLNLIWIGDKDNPISKCTVNWIDLEVSDNLYTTDTKQSIQNEDGTIKESYFIKKTTKELIYNELKSLYFDTHCIKKNKIDLKKRDEKKLTELKALKKYYEKYIDKQNLISLIYMKETSKKMKELNKRSYINKDFNKELVSSVYDEILSDINLQINRIVHKGKNSNNSNIKKYERKSFIKIKQILKNDYEEQKELFKLKEKELKAEIKEYEDNFKDPSQLKYDLEKLQRKFNEKNLRNYKQKAIDFFYNNGININSKHT